MLGKWGTGMMEDRLEQVRQAVDDILRQQPDGTLARCGFVHLYGVSAVCVLLAEKRGLDAELCAVAGMLHDISSYKLGDSTNHARLSAIEADRILDESRLFADDEIAQITDAVSKHCAKDETDDTVAELLKDADVLQHYLYDPGLEITCTDRLERILAELGLEEDQ